MIDVHRVARALRDHFGGTLVNVQVLCNTQPHLHAHVSVRYLDGDVAPTVPLPMDDLVEISDDELESDAKALHALLEAD
jgi:diadenosine tetraphosphate (Ap4A) HIT family hydrolase